MGSTIIKNILVIILGVVLMAIPGQAIDYVIIIVGAALVLFGLLSISSYLRLRKVGSSGALAILAGIIVMIVLGLFLIITPKTFTGIMMFVLGILAVAAAGLQVYTLVSERKDGFRIPGYMYIFPFILLLAGVMVMVRPNWSLEAIVIVFGACCIVYAVVDLINLWLIGRQREALGKE